MTKKRIEDEEISVKLDTKSIKYKNFLLHPTLREAAFRASTHFIL
ncbi:hypothetical protein [Nostoc sp.]